MHFPMRYQLGGSWTHFTTHVARISIVRATVSSRFGFRIEFLAANVAHVDEIAFAIIRLVQIKNCLIFNFKACENREKGKWSALADAFGWSYYRISNIDSYVLYFCAYSSNASVCLCVFWMFYRTIRTLSSQDGPRFDDLPFLWRTRSNGDSTYTWPPTCRQDLQLALKVNLVVFISWRDTHHGGRRVF